MSSKMATVLAVITLLAGFVLAHATANPASALSLRPRHDPAAASANASANASAPPAPAAASSAGGASASR